MSKSKLNLRKLQVKSFVTSFEQKDIQTIQGGRIAIDPIFVRDTAKPSACNVSCLPPKSEGCFSEAPGNCTKVIL